MKNFLRNFILHFKNQNDINIYSIQELKEIKLKEKKIKLAKKSREYISELNRKQRLWLEKSNRNLRKAS